MSNRPDCKPPELPEHAHVFRQTFLRSITRPDLVAGLDALAEFLMDGSFAVEGCRAQQDDTSTVQEIASIVGDLDHLCHYLDYQGRTVEEAELTPAEAALCIQCYGWRDSLDRMALEIRHAVEVTRAELRADETGDDDEDEPGGAL